MPGKYLEEFVVGEIFSHDIHRTITETDNILFSSLTMNPARIHIDYDYASKTEFGKPLVNSILTLGLVVGTSVSDTTLGTTIANLGWEEVNFPNPVFIGDTIHAETEVIAKRDSKSRPNQGIVTLLHRGRNQHGDIVCECRRLALMMKRP